MKRIPMVALIIAALTFPVILLGAGKSVPKLNQTGRTVQDFVPKGWSLIKQAKGDLNTDDLDDLVGVVERNGDKGEDGFGEPRVLFIALHQKDGGYQLSAQSGKAVFRSGEGGVWGDPLDDVTVNRGSVLISLYGGSNWRWGYQYRFRYQDGGWYLIGATAESSFTVTGEGDQEDYNLLTGKMIKTVIDENGKRTETTTNRGRRKLVPLQEFDVYNADKQY